MDQSEGDEAGEGDGQLKVSGFIRSLLDHWSFMPSVHLRDMTEVFSPLTKGHIVSVIVNITNCFCLFVFDMSTSQWCWIEVQARNLTE